MLDTEAFANSSKAGILARRVCSQGAAAHAPRGRAGQKQSYYMSYLGVVLARSEEKFGEASGCAMRRAHEAQSGAALFESRGSVYTAGGAKKRWKCSTRAEICAQRYPADDREKSIGAAQDSGAFVLSRQHPVNRQLGRCGTGPASIGSLGQCGLIRSAQERQIQRAENTEFKKFLHPKREEGVARNRGAFSS